MCRLRLGENTESIIYLLYVGMIIIIIHNVTSWSLMSSSSFLKIIKQTTSVSLKINKIFFCNINICYGGCKLPQIWTLWWGLTSHGWHLCKTILLKVCKGVTNLLKVRGFVTSNISIWTTCEKDFSEIMIWAFTTSDDSNLTLWREISSNHTYANYLVWRIFIYKLYLYLYL